MCENFLMKPWQPSFKSSVTPHPGGLSKGILLSCFAAHTQTTTTKLTQLYHIFSSTTSTISSKMDVNQQQGKQPSPRLPHKSSAGLLQHILHVLNQVLGLVLGVGKPSPVLLYRMRCCLQVHGVVVVIVSGVAILCVLAGGWGWGDLVLLAKGVKPSV